MQLKNSVKEVLRKKILADRKIFDEELNFLNNQDILSNVKDVLNTILLKKTRNESLKKFDKLDTRPVLGLYLPIKGEPDLLRLVINSGFSTSLPKLKGEKMDFVLYQAGSRLERSSFGKLMQPTNNTKVLPDVAIIPGLAFSVNGNRLGFGVGHYDRYFAKNNQKKNGSTEDIIKIGVFFHGNLYEYLPHESHDLNLDYLITDKTIIIYNHKK